VTEFRTVGVAMYDFPIVVNSVRGSISHGLGATSLQSQICALPRGGGSLKNPPEFESFRIFKSGFHCLKAECCPFVAPSSWFKLHFSMLWGS
jgi:hypothetical protein